MQSWFHNVKICREMRCLRHKIHIGLFVALIFTDLAWILAAFIQVVITGILNLFTKILFLAFRLLSEARLNILITRPSSLSGAILTWFSATSISQHSSGCFQKVIRRNEVHFHLNFFLPEEIESFKLREETALHTTDNISKQEFFFLKSFLSFDM